MHLQTHSSEHLTIVSERSFAGALDLTHRVQPRARAHAALRWFVVFVDVCKNLSWKLFLKSLIRAVVCRCLWRRICTNWTKKLCTGDTTARQWDCYETPSVAIHRQLRSERLDRVYAHHSDHQHRMSTGVGVLSRLDLRSRVATLSRTVAASGPAFELCRNAGVLRPSRLPRRACQVYNSERSEASANTSEKTHTHVSYTLLVVSECALYIRSWSWRIWGVLSQSNEYYNSIRRSVAGLNRN